MRAFHCFDASPNGCLGEKDARQRQVCNQTVALKFGNGETFDVPNEAIVNDRR